MNIIQDVKNAGLTYNRYPEQQLQLPYAADEILIQPNDTVSSDVINLKLQHLHDNFLYLYSKSKIASNLIPVSMNAYAGVPAISSQATWTRGLSTSQFRPFSAAGLSKLDNVKVLLGVNNTQLDVYTLFASTGSDIIIISSNTQETTFTPLLSTETYNTLTQTNVYFQQITDLVKGPDNSLLVVDSVANTIFKYDLTGFYDNNNTLNNKLVFQNALGGTGTISDKLRFNRPQSVCTYNNFIFVLDADNLCVKKYDANLNWYYTYGLQRDLVDVAAIKIRVDSAGNFYILTGNRTIIRYDNNFINKTIIPLANIPAVAPTEIFSDIVFSETDSNIFYIVSNRNIYKRFVDNPDNSVGEYLLYLYGINTNYTLNCFTTMPVSDGDRNVLYTTSSASNAKYGVFSSFFDNINLYDNLAIPSFDIYSADSMLIQPDEYVQSWVINKALTKMYTNHIRFIDQIIGKFQFKYDSSNNSVFQFTRYLTADEKQTLSLQIDNIL